MKWILYLSIICTVLLMPRVALGATDLTITCPADGNTCDLKPQVSLFTESNLYPGYVQDPAQKITILNEHIDQCNLKMSVENVSGDILLTKVIGIKVFSDTETLVNSTLDQLMMYHHTIAFVPPKTAQTYSWLAWIDPAAGNEFQKLTAQFAQVYHFTCIPLSTPAPAKVPSPTNTPSPIINLPHEVSTRPLITSSVDIINAEKCTETVPDMPYSFAAYPSMGGQSATLTWAKSPSPHTGYQIVMGSNPAQLIYRSIDVGDVNTYVIDSLTSGAQYCFYIQAANGCALSTRTQTDCINVGSPVTAAQKPSDTFKENILGATDTTENPKGQVLGASTNSCKLASSPILFLFAALLGLGLYFLLHRTIHIGAHMLISVFLSSLVMVLYVYFYQACRSSHMVAYYVSCIVPFVIMFVHTALKDQSVHTLKNAR